MGGQSSKGGGAASSVPTDLAGLTSYEAACKADPALETFDRTLQQEIYQAINSIAVQASSRSVSFDSFKVLTNIQGSLNHEIVKMILECQKDSWDKTLYRLVEDYFKTSDLTLRFLTALQSSLARARDGQVILQFAAQHFEEEQTKAVAEEGNKYAKTLKELKKFKDAGSPFKDEFFSVLRIVSSQQVTLLQKLQAQKMKVDKKLKTAKTWARVSNVLFVAAFVSALIFSVVAAAIHAPAVVIALATAMTVPIGSVGKWCNNLWNKYKKELKDQNEFLDIMRKTVTVHDVETIRVLVDKLKLDQESVLQTADFALAEDDVAVELVMIEIKGKLEGFMNSIEELLICARKCSEQIGMVRTVISQRIISNSSN